MVDKGGRRCARVQAAGRHVGGKRGRVERGHGELGGGHGDWAGQWAGLRADSEEDTGKSAEMAEAAAAKEGEAARGLRHAAAAVAAAEAERGRSSPDMQEAVAARKEAVAAAGRAEEDGAADQAE